MAALPSVRHLVRAQPGPVPNPPIADSCGTDVVLVLDASGSISSSGAVDLARVSSSDGAVTVIASSERSMSVGVDAEGRIAVASDGPVSTTDPDVVVATAPTDRFLYDLDW